MVSRSATQEGISPCKNRRTCSNWVLKWTNLGLASEGEVCARIGDGLPSLVPLASTATTGRFIADLTGSPFFNNGALCFRTRVTGVAFKAVMLDVVLSRYWPLMELVLGANMVGVLVAVGDGASGVAYSGGVKSAPGSEVLMVRLCVFGL